MGIPGQRNGDASEGTLLDILGALGGTPSAGTPTIGVGTAPKGPGLGSATAGSSRIWNFAFTANTAANQDISGTAALAGLLAAIAAGKLLVVKATSACWYNWGTSAVTIAANSTAASNPATQGVPLFDGERADERVDVTATKLNILGGPVAGILSIYVAE